MTSLGTTSRRDESTESAERERGKQRLGGRLRERVGGAGAAAALGGVAVLRGFRALRGGKRVRGLAQVAGGALLGAAAVRRRRSRGTDEATQTRVDDFAGAERASDAIPEAGSISPPGMGLRKTGEADVGPPAGSMRD